MLRRVKIVVERSTIPNVFSRRNRRAFTPAWVKSPDSKVFMKVAVRLGAEPRSERGNEFVQKKAAKRWCQWISGEACQRFAALGQCKGSLHDQNQIRIKHQYG